MLICFNVWLKHQLAWRFLNIWPIILFSTRKWKLIHVAYSFYEHEVVASNQYWHANRHRQIGIAMWKVKSNKNQYLGWCPRYSWFNWWQLPILLSSPPLVNKQRNFKCVELITVFKEEPLHALMVCKGEVRQCSSWLRTVAFRRPRASRVHNNNLRQNVTNYLCQSGHLRDRHASRWVVKCSAGNLSLFHRGRLGLSLMSMERERNRLETSLNINSVYEKMD